MGALHVDVTTSIFGDNAFGEQFKTRWVCVGPSSVIVFEVLW